MAGIVLDTDRTEALATLGFPFTNANHDLFGSIVMLDRETLRRLGNGVRIDTICTEKGWDRAEFDRRWLAELASRTPAGEGSIVAGVEAEVQIDRDRWGIPHIRAANAHDLW